MLIINRKKNNCVSNIKNNYRSLALFPSIKPDKVSQLIAAAEQQNIADTASIREGNNQPYSDSENNYAMAP